KRNGVDANLAALFEVLPAPPRNLQNLFRFGVGVGLYHRQVWHVRPGLAELETVDVELIVQLAHPVSAVRHANENRGSSGNEAFDVAHGDFERPGGGTYFLQYFDGLFFRSD